MAWRPGYIYIFQGGLSQRITFFRTHIFCRTHQCAQLDRSGISGKIRFFEIIGPKVLFWAIIGRLQRDFSTLAFPSSISRHMRPQSLSYSQMLLKGCKTSQNTCKLKKYPYKFSIMVPFLTNVHVFFEGIERNLTQKLTFFWVDAAPGQHIKTHPTYKLPQQVSTPTRSQILKKLHFKGQFRPYFGPFGPSFWP